MIFIQVKYPLFIGYLDLLFYFFWARKGRESVGLHK